SSLQRSSLARIVSDRPVGGAPEALSVPPRLMRHITLEQAQQAAKLADPLTARLGDLGVEAANDLRHAAQADYLPQFGTTFVNVHFNKFMGQEIEVTRPGSGTTTTVAIPLIGQDQTLFAVNGIQPITQLLKVRQEVKVARADENIARAKAVLPVTTSTAVEKTYFDLLVAQKQMELAELRARHEGPGRRVALSPARTVNVAPVESNAVDVDDELQELSQRVKGLNSSLNQLIGWPDDTPLELEQPTPLIENISLRQ